MTEATPKKKSFREELADRYPKPVRKQAGKDGVVTIRLSGELHDRLYDTARRESMSMNRICTVAIERALDDIEADPSEYFRDPVVNGSTRSNNPDDPES